MITLRTSYLELGMYVESLDRSWAAIPLLMKSFMITDIEHLRQLQKYCQTVVIDEEKSEAFVKKKLRSYHHTHVLQRKDIWKHINYFHRGYNIESADETYKDSLNLLRDIWNDFQQKNSTDAFKIKNCIRRIINEVASNADALTLFSTLKSKRQDSAHHCLNVCIFSLLLGRHLKLSEQQLFELAYGALLHDIGEIKISQAVLNKYHRGLTPEEKKELEVHPKYGAEILSTIYDVPKAAINIVRSHHERVNGHGYPDGLVDFQISDLAKMVAIINAYEIVINYPKAKTLISHTDALKSVYKMCDSFFDKDLVEEFIQCLGAYPTGSVIELSNKEIGIVLSSKPEKRLYPVVMVVKDREDDLLEQPDIINLEHLKSTLQITKVLPPSALGTNIAPTEYAIKHMGIKWEP